MSKTGAQLTSTLKKDFDYTAPEARFKDRFQIFKGFRERLLSIKDRVLEKLK